MKKYFQIKLEFNRETIHQTIHQTVSENQKGYVCAINSNNFVVGYKNKIHEQVLNNSLINICDGSVMALILSIIHRKRLNPYPGPDLFINLLKQKKASHLFLGSTTTVLKGLGNNLPNIIHKDSTMFFQSLPYREVDSFDYKNIANLINSLNVDIIWVSLGAPKQEQFMSKLLPYINRGVLIGVGAAFLFYSGISTYSRAPLLFRKMKMESIYRILQSPRIMLKRVLPQIPTLFILIFKEISWVYFKDDK